MEIENVEIGSVDYKEPQHTKLILLISDNALQNN